MSSKYLHYRNPKINEIPVTVEEWLGDNFMTVKVRQLTFFQKFSSKNVFDDFCPSWLLLERTQDNLNCFSFKPGKGE
jgi:hypothetical protein